MSGGPSTPNSDMSDEEVPGGVDHNAAASFSQGNFHAIAAISSDAIISLDAEQRIVFFNEGAERIFGYRAEEMLGSTLEPLLPRHAGAAHRRHVESFGDAQVSARRMGEREEIAGVRKGGEEFPAEASISKLDIDGERIYTVVLRDITQRRKAELGQSFLSRAGEILASSLDYVTTLKSVARLAVSHMADWCAVYMRDEDGVVRRLEATHVDPDLQPLVLEVGAHHSDSRGPYLARRALESGRVELFSDVDDHLLRDMAQSEDHLDLLRRLDLRSALVAPLITRDRTLGAIGLFSSRPDRYGPEDVALAAELARRAALAVDNARLYREAQQAVQARDDVLSIVSHDVGTSLSAIFLGTKVLLRQLDPEDAAMVRTVHMCREAAQQIQRLINDLLDVQRLEAGRLVPEQEEVRVESILESTAELLSPLALDKAISLNVEVRGAVPPILADRDRVLQVLSNLVSNAIKYSPESAEIRITAEPGSDGVVFAIEDRGAGIPADELPRIFDRFWQARRNRRPGAGLGLAIAKGIVEAHGGELWVESEEGEGTTARFTLPAARRGEVGSP